ncbi:MULTISPECIES: molecular chaperone [Pseudomonas]|uniref:fimbrial biogenesis chaperone n=1 Tax=Pseudomonas TaxID=286 RepID=UPI0010707585|nr:MULTISPECIES: molecular chaperone [Pseudomonas]QBR32087.1 molecular chaperone [Pseudomonas sp. S150]UZT90249.1 molecular chaperone [Pseudomonas koreensis]
MFKLLILGCFALGSAYAQANIILNGTRIIYHESKGFEAVQLTSTGADASLVQAWIDDGDVNSTPETAQVPFLLSPPIVKVLGHGGQQLRIEKTDQPVYGDRESVFYLNILEVPAFPEHLQGQNTLQLALRTRVKLFYRPSTLKSRPDFSSENIRIVAHSTGVSVFNDNAYHLTIVRIAEKNSSVEIAGSNMIAPYASLDIPGKSKLEPDTQYILTYVDDLGAYRDEVVTLR